MNSSHPPNMDMAQVRHFVRVAEAGSFIKAADLLGMTQPTLSRQVRALETQLRASLFYRHGRGVLLTEAGKRFLDHARALLHAADAAILAARDAIAAYDGRLVLGLTPSVGRVLIPVLAPRLRQRFPRATISIVEGLSGALYDQALIGQLDFAVLHNPAASPNLDIVPLASEPLYLIGPRRQGTARAAVPLRAVAQLPLIMPNRSHAVRPVLEAAAARLGLGLNITLEIDATQSIADLVEQGEGYSVVPLNSRRSNSPTRLAWQKITHPVMETTLCMVSPVGWPRSPMPREAAQLTRDILAGILKRR